MIEHYAMHIVRSETFDNHYFPKKILTWPILLLSCVTDNLLSLEYSHTENEWEEEFVFLK